MLHFAQLIQAIIPHARPRRESRQPRFACDPPAELFAGFGEMHGITASAQNPRALESGRTRADHEERIVSGTRRYCLRVPTLAPFLAHGGILCAADRCHGVVAGHADIAADAFADIVAVAALDFL